MIRFTFRSLIVIEIPKMNHFTLSGIFPNNIYLFRKQKNNIKLIFFNPFVSLVLKIRIGLGRTPHIVLNSK